jgi:hypothetical protein
VKNDYVVDDIYDDDNNRFADKTDIHLFSVKYGIPHVISNKLIGKNEEETSANISILSKAIDEYVDSKIIDVCTSEGYGELEEYLAPYGWARMRGRDELIKLYDEQMTIKLIIELKQQGMSYSKIRDELKKRGIEPRRSVDGWSRDVLRSIYHRNSDKQDDNEE